MNQIKTHISYTIIFLLQIQTENLQYQSGTQMAPSHLLYVVLAVCIVVLTGIFIYLFYIERKLNKQEKNLSQDRI